MELKIKYKFSCENAHVKQPSAQRPELKEVESSYGW